MMGAPVRRFVSLDFCRGLAVVGMILATNPGSHEHVSGLIRHAAWNGWSLGDLVFPVFLFLVGVSIAVSLEPEPPAGEARYALRRKVLRRTLVLFALGLADNAFPFTHLAGLRIPGVLQRIAVVYCLGVGLHVHCSRQTLAWLVSMILIGYWLLLALAPVPGLGYPALEPGRNLAAWLDRLVLHGHLWDERFADPEGLLSTLPALGLTVFGMLAGDWLKGRIVTAPGAAFFFGLFLFLGGLAWDAVQPINKFLFTSSFALLAGGVAFMLLVGAHALLDGPHGPGRPPGRVLAPFTALGRNAILVFALSAFSGKTLDLLRLGDGRGGSTSLHDLLYGRLLASWLPPDAASFAWAALLCGLFTGLAWFLDSRRIRLHI